MSPPCPVVAIYGGSFNPPHVGHAMVTQYVLWMGHASAVWLLPVHRHAFEGRHDKILAPFEDRVRWCAAMASEIQGDVQVCTVERSLPPPNYTYVTLVHLAKQHPQLRFRLIIGADSVPHLTEWHRWDDIVDQFDPIVIGRQGHPCPEGVHTVDMPGVSSTEVRRRLAAGNAVGHLLTREVAALLNDASPWTP